MTPNKRLLLRRQHGPCGRGRSRRRDQASSVKAALDAARQRNAELKAIRAGLRTGELTLEELLAQAQSDHAAGRMPVRTALLALPGIRSARASQVVAPAGIDPARRAGGLTTGQQERLVAAATAVDAELAARRGRRTEHSGPVLRSRAPG
jgi:hypothetical protein